MSERTDRKLREVAIGRYGFRHEAEFAAGFLDEADIPYRLQIDDPAMGFDIGSSATIWVREMDLVLARELLEVPDRTVTVRAEAPVRRHVRPTHPVLVKLSIRERLLAAAGSLGLVGIATMVLDGASNPTWARLVVMMIAVLSAIAFVGLAPPSLKRLLGALSGNVP